MKMRFPECLFKVRRTALLAVLAALAVFADEAPWNTYIVDRTVEVSPGARKNKAFPMEEGSAFCDKNDAFGKKKAILLLNGRKLEESDYEVFFPKNATNHPGGQAGSPNWFYYWGQTSANKGNTTIKYLNATRSYYDYASDRTIFIANDAALSQISIWGTPKGIDCYAWTTAHEAKHHRQITNFWPTQWRAVDDTDMDWLPNDQEPIYMPGRPYSPTNPATYPDVFGYGQNPIRDCEDINMRSQNPPYSLDKLWPASQ